MMPAGVNFFGNQAAASAEYEPYDKMNPLIVSRLWDAMYKWVDDGTPMPWSRSLRRDPTAPDGIARDLYGNAVRVYALPGLRCPTPPMS
jgi:hypothetical protein